MLNINQELADGHSATRAGLEKNSLPTLLEKPIEISVIKLKVKQKS
jgi:hypothetical protein